jgi:hypothetical protein
MLPAESVLISENLILMISSRRRPVKHPSWMANFDQGLVIFTFASREHFNGIAASIKR